MSMLNRLKTVLKGDAKSESPVQIDVVPIAIQKQQGFFAQKNNLIDYEENAPAIETSNFSAHERYVFPIEIPYGLYYLQAEDQEQLVTLMERVQKGETQGLTTIAEFARKYFPVLNEEVEKYENDIENMPSHYKQLPKPDYGKTTTAKISLKPAQVFSEDTDLQVEDLGVMPIDTYHIEITELHLAFANRPESDTRRYGQFRDDWIAKDKIDKVTKAINLLKGEEDADIIQ